MNLFKKIQSSFLIGLAFVACAYILIKIIDNYQLFFNGIQMLLNAMSPFIIAFVVAYLLNPVVNYLETKFKMKRTSSLTITYFSIILILFLSISF
ncbi:MAG TPA: AI-2E family transporter, partial [Firmicutes bacterium]|nr:AI-2E family transporter [Bacillota bacterium]